MAGTTAATPSGVSSPYSTYTGSVPDSGAFGMYQAQANKAYEDSLAQLQNQQSSFLTQQGLQAQYDPTTGMARSLSVDANDPTGAYQQLQQALGQQQEAVNAGADSSSLGFGGALARQAQAAQSQASQGQLQNWAQGVQGQIQGIQAQQQSNYDSMQQALAAQQLQDIQNAIASGSFNPAMLGGNPSNPSPASAAGWEPAWYRAPNKKGG